MEALGAGGDRASPASSTRSLALRRLSSRADSAYSSLSAASGGPEQRTPSPGTDLLPYLDWDSVRVVWGGPAPAPPDAAPRTSPRPGPAVAARGGPQPPEVRGLPGPLNRQATPLLYALAAEAEAAARAAEPPSPPASRAAYRQRLQGAQRRVLRETSFQRKELRMSLPARLRPAAPARPPAAHPRSASLSHPGGEVEPPGAGTPAPGTAGRGGLANQQRKWCFSEPGKLDRVGRGGGPAGGCTGEACSSSGLSRPQPQELLAEFECRRMTWLPRTRPRSTASLHSGSSKLADTYRPAGRSRSASGGVLGSWGGSGGAMPSIQVWKTGDSGRWGSGGASGTLKTRATFQSTVHLSRLFLKEQKLPDHCFRPNFPELPPGHCRQCGVPASRFLTQKETTVVCPANHEQRVSETSIVSAQLPPVSVDEVFLEEAPLVRMRSPPDSQAPEGLPTRVHASDQCGTDLGQRASVQAEISPEDPLHEHPGTAGADDCRQRVNGSADVSRPTSCSPPGTANGDIPAIDPTGQLTTDPLAAAESDLLKLLPVAPEPPRHTALAWTTGQPGSRPTWPSQRLEELVQELARLDPSLCDTLAFQPSPELPLGLLDGLIPLAEVCAAVSTAHGEAGEEAAGTSEPGSYQFSFTQLLPTSQEETRLENPATYPVPDQPSSEGFLAPNNSIQAKKVELAGLLQKMLRDLHAEQERLRGAAQAWARSQAALEAAVSQACTARQLERFSQFMADLERVLGLLLLLASRLARVRRALAWAGSEGDPEERASLLQRLGFLQRQQQDAQQLKEHVARRERDLREVLVRALPVEELRSYGALLAGKAAVLAQQRSLDERVRFLRDQLDAVSSDLGHHPLSPRPETCPPDEQPLPPPLT
ncbi:PREDICTED: protein Shroom1 isoform X3 [Propithecus coquereli]|nr:PREDICTED: protein Shroom1 isoform X3 [Propithecus coquereli]